MQCVEVMLLLEILAVFTACKNNKLKKKNAGSLICLNQTLNPADMEP